MPSDTFDHEADAWDSLSWWDEDDHAECNQSYSVKSKRTYTSTCNKCGMQDLFWTQTADGWRLHEKGDRNGAYALYDGLSVPHMCKKWNIEKDVSPDIFKFNRPNKGTVSYCDSLMEEEMK